MAMHEGVWFAPSEPDAAAGLKTLTRRAAWARSDGGNVSSLHVVSRPRAAAALAGCCCCCCCWCWYRQMRRRRPCTSHAHPFGERHTETSEGLSGWQFNRI